jgi:two-component system response regulator
MNGSQVKAPSTNKTGNTRLVLLIEDNLNDEMLALRALKMTDASIKVDVARDGIEALDYLTDPNRPCPDLVLLDLKLPKISGVEVLKSARAAAKTRRALIVVFTSSNEQSDIVRCFDSGANGFVQNSVDFEEYMLNLSKLADYWLNVNQSCLPVSSGFAIA